MRGKKLVLLLVMLCLVLTEGGVLTYAKESSDSKKSTTSEKSTEAASEEAKEEETILQVEVSNVTNTLMSALSQSVAATLTIEREKLPKYSEEDLMYLACIIYCESGDQDFEGMVAVANVVMNRAKSEEFDHVTTIKEVIYDCERWGRQFSPAYKRDSNGKWTTKGSFLEKTLTMYKTGVYPKDWQQSQMERCIVAAKAALEGEVVLKEDYLYFNMAISKTKEKCKKQGRTYQVIGYHIFY